jgi:replicative DNA helicase
LLSSDLANETPAKAVLSQLVDGDLVLLGARPGHGKTLLGLEPLHHASRAGRRAAFFTLEYTERETIKQLREVSTADSKAEASVEIVASDDISADFIIKHLSGAAPGTIAVIDYLQILDQKRSHPTLNDQLRVLKDFASATGAVLGFITQIDRRFVPGRNLVPGLEDLRLPNPIQQGLFSKACFLHDGTVRLQQVA